MSPAATVITIALDGQPYPLPAGTTLVTLITQLGHEANAVSTAVNGQFVARAARTGYVLQEGDQVLLFQPIVGG
ncbi:MAG: sulfur carrier protein ThiS [Burkholderiaceae bacterium]|jgi:sulfur carrier protein|nr:sulfur carrier protein ThiS [Burkholderiaceae bacterium]